MSRKLNKSIQAIKQRSLITFRNPKSPVSEQYRTIRTNIEFSAVDANVQTIMVTSSGPEEGKSTTAANMAVVFAQQGKRVLLIDGDLRKPTVHYTFHLENSFGLTSVLTKQSTVEQAYVKSEIDSLDILPSGPVPPNPAELLGSQAMHILMSDLRKTYDIVIFDTPPVLAVTDAQVLANQCDGVVLVTASGKTEVEAAKKAKELLENARAKLLGVVLNQKPVKQSNYYYYYGRN
ncbi:CpsD/CapB family tyrosine-protein kinase [Aureibacillus halotolerans]|uniref:non-specific protein-tyrosine kinase n=1 Tax=Aureibacillus halotolerans TaxID=1508390 RepID=A0A4R6TZ82_9BACI|nr:CpsD/CapB family tyrosine-protein kinase [Aureibacillus halotolerans]TDQ38656.1 capsular exopolysaccharide synthesis family protein [Aureibacillus halotolerans]